MTSPPSILWFRRDLRFEDHPALAKAARLGPVLPLFVLDPALMRPAGLPRRAFILRTLRDMDHRLRTLGASLVVISGRPEEVLPEFASRVGATAVHVSADFAPYGSARDRRVADALGPVPLVATGSPYAVSPPRLTTKSGLPYKVFTPFYRAWREHGWPDPASSDPGRVDWVSTPGEAIPEDPMLPPDLVLPSPERRRRKTRGGGSGKSAFGVTPLSGTGQMSTRRLGFPHTCISAYSTRARSCPHWRPKTNAS